MTKQFVLFAGIGRNGRTDLWESDGTAAGQCHGRRRSLSR
jgi:hypothetical protein